MDCSLLTSIKLRRIFMSCQKPLNDMDYKVTVNTYILGFIGTYHIDVFFLNLKKCCASLIIWKI